MVFELLLAPPANRFKGVRNEDSTDDEEEEDEDADDEPSALGAEDLSLKGLELALVIALMLAVSLLHS